MRKNISKLNFKKNCWTSWFSHGGLEITKWSISKSKATPLVHNLYFNCQIIVLKICAFFFNSEICMPLYFWKNVHDIKFLKFCVTITMALSHSKCYFGKFAPCFPLSTIVRRYIHINLITLTFANASCNAKKMAVKEGIFGANIFSLVNMKNYIELILSLLNIK